VYVPSGKPLRPELRILALAPHERKPGSSSSSSSGGGGGAAAESCSEKASDALSVKGYRDYIPTNYQFVPSYGNELALMSAGWGGQRRGGQGGRQSGSQGAAGGARQQGAGAAADTPGGAKGVVGDQEGDVVEDFGEFMYFIVSPKVSDKVMAGCCPGVGCKLLSAADCCPMDMKGIVRPLDCDEAPSYHDGIQPKVGTTGRTAVSLFLC
jgi:hypothetical protein